MSATEALQQRVPGVSLTDVQGNGFFQDLRYRGFAASPLQGTPQGLAVYVNGMRVTEQDLAPGDQVAIGDIILQAKPVIIIFNAHHFIKKGNIVETH